MSSTFLRLIIRLSLTFLFVVAALPVNAATDEPAAVPASKQASRPCKTYPGNNAKLAGQLLSKANLLATQQQYDLAIRTYVDSYLADWRSAKHGEICSSQLAALASRLDPVRGLQAYRMALFCDHYNRGAIFAHGRLMGGGADNPVELEKTGDACLKNGDRFGALVEYSQCMEKANNADVRRKFKQVLGDCGFASWPLSWSSESAVSYGAYMQIMQAWLRAAWVMDVHDSPSSYRVDAMWKIGKNGELSGLKILKSSGTATLDTAALDTVRLVAPFRKPPESNEKFIDIEFVFDYNNLAKDGRSRSNRDGYLKTLMTQAKAATEAGNYSESCKILKTAEASATGKTMAFVQGKLVDALLLQASLPTVSSKEALELARQAYRREADNPNVLSKLEQGIRATGKDPNSFDDRVTMGDGCLAERDFESAAVEYKAAAALQNEPPIQVKLAAAESKVKALKNLERWKGFAAENPKVIEAQMSIGLACKDLGEQEQAITAYRKVLELDPQNASAKKALAELSEQQERK